VIRVFTVVIPVMEGSGGLAGAVREAALDVLNEDMTLTE